MEDILKDINAVVGVTGSFVCNEEGEVLASALPGIFDETMLSVVGRTAVQTVAGLQTARRRKIGDIDLIYTEGRFIVKNLRRGCLCILCVPRINVPLLNMTAKLAARKLAAMIKEGVDRKPEAIAKALPLAELSNIAEEVLGETGRLLFESELKKLGITEEMGTLDELSGVLSEVEKAFAVFVGSARARRTVELMRGLIEGG